MSRSLNRLSARKVAALSQPGMHADGGGLYLQVSRYNTKSWVFRFTLNKRAREMGLGSLQNTSLADARVAAEKCRALLHDRIDPIEHRRNERVARSHDLGRAKTFKECATAYIKSHSAGWKSAKHAAQWDATLKTYAHPVLGDQPVDAIHVGMVMEVLDPIWQTKTETASRVRGRIESILDWATARDYRSGENPARWKGRLEKLLPPKSKVRRVKHHKALPYRQIGSFMATLREHDGIVARGLEFTILTAARTEEVTGAMWREIDLDRGVWTVPGERMKNGKEHRVPLSRQALDILMAIELHEGSEFIFPGRVGNSRLSDMAMLQHAQRMDFDKITVHGFRSTFRDWAGDCTNHQHEVAELSLAHTEGDKVVAAYRRGDMFEKRRRLMNDWANFCDATAEKQSGNVVKMLDRT